jgi:endonuclease-3
MAADPSRRRAVPLEPFLSRLAEAYPGWHVPVITLMANRGLDPFGVLVSTLLSLRTKDAVTHAASQRLLAAAGDPAAMLALEETAIARLIYPVGFYRTKARRLHEISRALIARHGGRVPAEMDLLLALPGVGRKTANLVLIEGFGRAAICVDTHVHRISNRVGLVRSATPERTEAALRRVLPRRHWIRYNEILVAFGQALCRPVSPLCSRCPVADLCPRLGVTRSR